MYKVKKKHAYFYITILYYWSYDKGVLGPRTLAPQVFPGMAAF